MKRLTIVVDVDDDALDTDPHKNAENLIDTYEIDRQHGFESRPEIRFVSAEWCDLSAELQGTLDAINGYEWQTAGGVGAFNEALVSLGRRAREFRGS